MVDPSRRRRLPGGLLKGEGPSSKKPGGVFRKKKARSCKSRRKRMRGNLLEKQVWPRRQSQNRESQLEKED